MYKKVMERIGMIVGIIVVFFPLIYGGLLFFALQLLKSDLAQEQPLYSICIDCPLKVDSTSDSYVLKYNDNIILTNLQSYRYIEPTLYAASAKEYVVVYTSPEDYDYDKYSARNEMPEHIGTVFDQVDSFTILPSPID